MNLIYLQFTFFFNYTDYTVHSESDCALRLWYSPVEMWWHTVTHGRRSSESHCALRLW